MSDLIRYTWSLYQGGVDKLTYFYADGSNHTYYRYLPQFNGVASTPFWMTCAVVVVVVVVVAVSVGLLVGLRKLRYIKK